MVKKSETKSDKPVVSLKPSTIKLLRIVANGENKHETNVVKWYDKTYQAVLDACKHQPDNRAGAVSACYEWLRVETGATSGSKFGDYARIGWALEDLGDAMPECGRRARVLRPHISRLVDSTDGFGWRALRCSDGSMGAAAETRAAVVKFLASAGDKLDGPAMGAESDRLLPRKARASSSASKSPSKPSSTKTADVAPLVKNMINGADSSAEVLGSVLGDLSSVEGKSTALMFENIGAEMRSPNHVASLVANYISAQANVWADESATPIARDAASKAVRQVAMRVQKAVSESGVAMSDLVKPPVDATVNAGDGTGKPSVSAPLKSAIIKRTPGGFIAMGTGPVESRLADLHCERAGCKPGALKLDRWYRFDGQGGRRLLNKSDAKRVQDAIDNQAAEAAEAVKAAPALAGV